MRGSHGEQVDPLMTSGAIPPLLIIMLQFGAVAHGEPMEHIGDMIMEENPTEISPQYIEVMTSPVKSNEDDISEYLDPP